MKGFVDGTSGVLAGRRAPRLPMGGRAGTGAEREVAA